MRAQQRSAGLRVAIATSPVLLLVLLLVGIPGALLLMYAFRESTFAGVGAGPTLTQFKTLLESDAYIRLTIRTIWISLVVASTVTGLATVAAYGIRIRFSRRVGLLLLGIVLTAGIASFLVRVYAWGTILGTNGLINSALDRLGVINAPLEFLFFGYFSVILTMTYLYLPIGLVIVYGAMQDIDSHTAEAARDLGAGRWRTLFQVVLPQARTGLMSCFLLVTVLACADYVTPALVGGRSGQTIGTLIRSQALATADLPGSAAMALGFMTLLASLLFAVLLVWRLAKPVRRGLGRAANLLAARTGAAAPRWWTRRSLSRPAALLVAAYLILPTVVVLVFSFNDASTLGLPWKGFTTKWYGSIIQKPGFSDALGTSIKLMLIGVGGAVALGTPFAFAMRRADGWWRKSLLTVIALPFVVPGILIGLGLLTIADVFNFPLGLWPTAAVHVMLLTPVVVLVVASRLAAMNPELIQAARDLGAPPPRAFRTITLPLILPSLVGAALVGAALSFDEIFVTTFTIGTDSTLPLWIFGQARIGFTPGLNALGVMLATATIAVPLGVTAITWMFNSRIRSDPRGAPAQMSPDNLTPQGVP